MKFRSPKFGTPALCLAALTVAMVIDLAVHRDRSVLAAIFGYGASSSTEQGRASKSPSDVAMRGRSRVSITPLPDVPVTINLRAINGAEVGTFAVATDGTVDSTNESALKRFLRCRRTGREHVLATGVLAMLVSVAQEWPGRVIDIVSGFRAPPFGVPHSKHFVGHAIDLRVEGIKTSKLRDFLWQTHHEIGVGFYLEENFVHMDWRPGEPDMAWSAGREGGIADYNPRWAWSVRHPPVNHACVLGCT